MNRVNIKNPSVTHLSWLFLINTSGAMAGEKIAEVETFLRGFKANISSVYDIKDILDIAIVEFNSEVKILQDFTSIENTEEIQLYARNTCNMRNGLRVAIDMIQDRFRFYRKLGIMQYRPWIVVITEDGYPDTSVSDLLDEISILEAKGQIEFCVTATKHSDLNVLKKLEIGRKVMYLDDFDYMKLLSPLYQAKGISTGESRTIPEENPEYTMEYPGKMTEVGRKAIQRNMDSENKATLNMYFLLDTSGSMAGERLEQLNRCMSNLVPELKNAACEEDINLVIRILTFGGAGVEWCNGTTAEHGVLIGDFSWVDIEDVHGPTPLTSAVEKLAEAIKPKYLGNKPILKPVAILVTDGCNTDPTNNFTTVCESLNNRLSNGVTRIAIGVGDQVDNRELCVFASEGSPGVGGKSYTFNAENSSNMVDLIHWSSMGSIKDAVNHSTMMIDSMCTTDGEKSFNADYDENWL